MLAGATAAEPLRLATWHGDFSRKGPGLLLRDLMGTREPSIETAVAILAKADADVLLLTSFDYDHGNVALGALATRLEAAGLTYPHLYSSLPNGGMTTDRDLDGDGLRGGPRDAQGYGWFAGDNGLAVLSRYPVTLRHDFSALLWQDVPDSAQTKDDPARDIQRLSSSAHWVLGIAAPGGEIALGVFAATPPVFDGPEDRNGRRNRDEAMLWLHFLDGQMAVNAPEARFVLIGNANTDPERGDGRREAIAGLLAHPFLTDPLPGKPTVRWDGPGEMRVSYILPSPDLPVLDAGVMPPGEDTGPHRLVWVEVDAAR